MTTTRYTTASRSIYDVRIMGPGNPVYVRRFLLGARHDTPERIAKRNADVLGGGDWVKLDANFAWFHGKGYPLTLVFEDDSKSLTTGAVVNVEENV